MKRQMARTGTGAHLRVWPLAGVQGPGGRIECISHHSVLGEGTAQHPRSGWIEPAGMWERSVLVGRNRPPAHMHDLRGGRTDPSVIRQRENANGADPVHWRHQKSAIRVDVEV